MRSFRMFIQTPVGLHARPCGILATIHKHYFRGCDVVLIDLTSGKEATADSIFSLMMLASPSGRELEFITMLDADDFEHLREIVGLLFFKKSRDEASADGRSEYSYDECFRVIAENVGRREQLLQGLHAWSNIPDRFPVFQVQPPTRPNEPPRSSVTISEICFGSATLALLDQVDPLLCEDAVVACKHLSHVDASGLFVLRRMCERLVKKLSEARGIAGGPSLPLAENIRLLRDANAITEFQKHKLNLLRFLGNATAHASDTALSDILPDRQSAFHLLKLTDIAFAQIARDIIGDASQMDAREVFAASLLKLKVGAQGDAS